MPPFVLASELLPGAYICLNTRSPLGKVVSWFCKSPYDHAILVTGPDEIIQATVFGVRKGTLSQFKGRTAVANAAEDMTAGQRDVAVTRARGFLGDKYGFATLLVIAARKLGFRHRWLLRFCDNRDVLICSELVAFCGQAAGLDWLCGEAEPALVRPDELAGRKPFMRTVVWD